VPEVLADGVPLLLIALSVATHTHRRNHLLGFEPSHILKQFAVAAVLAVRDKVD
jgi:hypothetical protein